MATKLIPYEPRSDSGSGFLPPLIRALTHCLFVIGASLHKWPITLEQATSEFEHAQEDLKGLIDIENIISGETFQHIQNWRTQLDEIHNTFSKSASENPTGVITTHHKILKVFTEQTWALTSILDQDLCGLRTDETDPGRLP